MITLAAEMLKLASDMADMATRLRAVGKSTDLEAAADDLMREAAALEVLAREVAAGVVK